MHDSSSPPAPNWDKEHNHFRIEESGISQDETIVSAFWKQVLLHPDIVAVQDDVCKLTYKELNEKSDRVAHSLAHLDQDQESLVAVYMPRSCDTIVTFLGILKAGLAYLPLDVNAPVARISSILSEIKQKTLFAVYASHITPKAITNERVQALHLSALLEGRTGPEIQSGFPALPRHTARSLSYVMFTSGSTGKPKGVAIEHRGVIRLAKQKSTIAHISQGTKIAHVATIAFDASTWEIYNALLNGGTLVCLSMMMILDLATLQEKFVREDIRVAKFTPMLLQQITYECPALLSRLDLLISAGDELHPLLARKVLACTNARFFNAYGPTENTGFSTCGLVTHAVAQQDVVSIGHAVQGSGAVVLDAEMQPVPIGAIGELVVFGDGLARGYSDPVQNEGRFIALRTSSGILRAYRTGDQARCHPATKAFDFLGRIDNQVKVRGYRIELAEIEKAIMGHPAVDSVAVLLQNKKDTEPLLVALFTLRGAVRTRAATSTNVQDLISDDGYDAEHEVRRWLADRVPDYMVPTVCKVLDHMPVNQNQKIDRQKLAILLNHLDQHRTTRDIVRPRDDTERAICDVYTTVFGHPVGITDSFFDMGGHSLIAMRIVSRINSQLGIVITIRNIFDNPIVSELATSIRDTATSMAYKPIPASTHNPTVEQSFAQGRLWFVEQLLGRSTRFIWQHAWAITGKLDAKALRLALEKLTERQEILRTTFKQEDEIALQTVQAHTSMPLPFQEHENLGHKGLMDALESERTTPFDLTKQAGWRAQLIQISSERHVLSIAMHHIIQDGWSMDILRQELSELYSAIVHRHSSMALLDLEVQYRHFSVWQRESIQMAEHERQLDYWRTYLENSAPAELIADKMRPSVPTGAAGEVKAAIGGSLYVKLRDYCRREHATPFAVLLSAFRAAQYRITHAEDATIGFPSANRNRREVENIIGFFVNTRCIRSSVRDDDSFADLVRQMHTGAVAALENQDVPFEKIVADLKLNSRDASRNPLVQLSFAVHAQKDFGKLSLDGLSIEVLPRPQNTRYDMEFHLFQNESSVDGYVLYAQELFYEETIENLVQIFLEILEQGLDKPHAPVSTLPLNGCLLAAEERALVQPSRSPYPQDSTILDEFLKQVNMNPDVIAVKDNSRQLTYQELADHSNALARWLNTKNYAAESLVGVFMARSCDTVVSFLAILKAGLAYLPLDVKAPTTRIEAIVSAVDQPELPIIYSESVPFGEGTEPRLLQLHFDDILHAAMAEEAQLLSSEQPLLNLSARSLAYVMFTSGSTGKPKGVMIEHRGVVRLAKQVTVTPFLSPGSRVAHMATIAFDASTWEIFTALLNGGTLVCIDFHTLLDPVKLGRKYAEEGISAAKFTPVLLAQCVQDAPETFQHLRVLLSSGDRLQPQLAQRVLKVYKGIFYNAYGPTESTGHSTIFDVRQEEHLSDIIPIGQAIGTSGAIVVDSNLRLVPYGVIGELLLIGDGLARGYLDTNQNLGRFVMLEVNKDTLIRAYRTGDYARRRPVDGELQFFGRIDQQVKIRGFRVELGEIEHAISRNSSIDNAIVLYQNDGTENPRLVAFATLATDDVDSARSQDASDEDGEVQAWADIRQTVVYADLKSVSSQSTGHDFVGWVSMYDGSEINNVDMEEWLRNTIREIRRAPTIRHVLEIGTGTGMILFNLATDFESYRGLDPVQHAVEFVDQRLVDAGLSSKASVQLGSAADVLQMHDFDRPTMVIVNSVAQYFPSPDYLTRLIEHLIRAPSVDTLYFGDMRSYAIYRQFKVTMARYDDRASRSLGNLKQYIEGFDEKEKELLVDPAYFTSLKAEFPDLVDHVEVFPKVMDATNELTCYRYGAMIHLRRASKPQLTVERIPSDSWIDFAGENLDSSSLLSLLSKQQSSSKIAVGNIPYSKTYGERQVLRRLDAEHYPNEGWLGSLDWDVHVGQALSAIDLVRLADEAGYKVEISCARQYTQQGGIDAVFYRRINVRSAGKPVFDFPTDHQDRPRSSFINRPLKYRQHRSLEKALQKELQDRLPAYMVPSVIKIIDDMPTNQNRKIDRRALLGLSQELSSERESSEIIPPQNETERVICEEFAAVLGTDVGRDDSFFDLGGHSLMATRVVSRITKRLDAAMTIKDVFDCPKVKDLALRVEAEVGQTLYKPIQHRSLRGPVRQSFAQGRLWFLEQLYQGSTHYLVPFRLRLQGRVDVSALESALYAMQSRHETLRTVFDHLDGEDVQIVQDTCPRGLEVDNLSSGEHSFVSKMLEAHQIRPFDHRKEPGWRVHLFRISDDEHILSIVLHHIVSDGWSMNILRRELEVLYAAALHGKQPLDSLAPLPIQYCDFSVWQREESQVLKHKKQLLYWTSELQGSQAAELPVDKARPAVLSGKAGEVPIKLSRSQYDKLQRFVGSHQVSPFTILLAAFRATMFCITGSTDAVVGSLSANRSRQELEGLIGFFVNLQGIRTIIDESTSFVGLVNQVRKKLANAAENEDVPFEMIVAELKLANRDASRTPLVQTTVALHPQQGSDLFKLEGLKVDVMDRSRRTRFDLELHFFQDEAGIQGYALFADDLFHFETILRTTEVFMQVLDQGLSEPEKAIAELSLVDCLPAEETLALRKISQTGFDSTSIVGCFCEQVQKHASAIAVIDGNSELTYKQLDEQSDKLARWLLDQGFDQDPEALVGVYMPRSCAAIVCFLGILKAGLVYLPLDVDAPLGRTTSILCAVRTHAAGLRPTLVFTESLPLPEGIQPDLAITAHFPTVLNSCGISNTPLPIIDANHLAYVIFTSGSTGTPKGVLIEHRGVVRLAKQVDTTKYASQETIAHLATLAFDASVWEIYMAILNGGTLVCLDRMTILDPFKLQVKFNLHGISVAKFTPVLLQQVLEECPRLLRGLKMLISAGDRLHTALAQKVLAQIPNIPFFNAYGPTENTGFSTCARVGNDFGSSVPIGRAINGSGAVVMDQNLRPVPAGVVGELVVFGNGLARGYLDSLQNESRFISLQLQNIEIRAYRTGDRVRRRPQDGDFEFLGRIDNQVKLRGHRIELGEIEHKILSYEAVSDAVVVMQHSGTEEARLAAFFTLKTHMNPASAENPVDHVSTMFQNQDVHIGAEIKRWLATQLPSYMVPSIFKAIKVMPVNQNRKVDRRLLVESLSLLDDDVSAPRNIVKPRNNAEHIICEEFSTILGVPVGITDNFFDLGGHSLVATRVVSRINSRLNCAASVFDLYQAATADALARRVSGSFQRKDSATCPGYMLYRSNANAKATIVLVHGFWGQGNAFLPLADRIGQDFDLVLIHDPYFGRGKAPDSILHWAEHYIKDLASLVRTDLPFIVGGFSFGGLIAFQIALISEQYLGRAPLSLLLLDAGSEPALSSFFDLDVLPVKSFHHAVEIFGKDQEPLIKQHFQNCRKLDLSTVAQQSWTHDALYFVTQESTSCDWWRERCPNMTVVQSACAHYELLGAGMTKNVAEVVGKHYEHVL